MLQRTVLLVCVLLALLAAGCFQTSESPVSPELFVERDGELAVLK